MDRKVRYGLAIGILVLVVIGLVCSSCQTLGGACRDIESAARYGHTHIVCEE